MQMLQRGD